MKGNQIKKQRKRFYEPEKRSKKAGKFLCLPFSNLIINFAPPMFFKFY